MPTYRLQVTVGRSPETVDLAEFTADTDTAALTWARKQAGSYIAGQTADPPKDKWRNFGLQIQRKDSWHTLTTWMPLTAPEQPA